MAQKLKIDIVAKDRSKQALQGLQGSLARVKASVFNLRNAFIGLGAGLVIRNIVNTGKQIENLQVQLKFLFGSAQEGAKAFDEMAKFASKVPFSLEEIQRGSGVLAVVSDDAEELAHLMKITGNVAAVTGLDFKTTAEQIQRSLSAGISAADLFRDKGVKEMLGFKAGATASVEETAAAFNRVFGKGGKFDGATDELAKTFSGTLSMIGDKVFNFKRVLLDAGFFTELKRQFGDLNKFLEDNAIQIEKIAITIGTNLAIAIVTAAKAIKVFTENFRELQSVLGLVLIIFGGLFYKIAGGALIINDINRRVEELFELQKKLSTEVKHGGEEFLKYAESVTKSTTALKKNTKQTDDLLKKMKELNKQILDFAKDEKLWQDNESFFQRFSRLNEEVLEGMKEKFKSIHHIIAKSIHDGVTKVSGALARSVIYGEKLSETFKKMVQDIAYRLLAGMIEWVIRLSWAWVYTKYIKKEEQAITREKKKQLALQIAIMALGGGGGGIPFFQHGGAVSKGKPVLVGERGPELFYPNTSGQITQNARGTGGGTTNVNFSITTLDASGFSEMLVQNRGTISAIINQAVNERGASNIV